MKRGWLAVLLAVILTGCSGGGYDSKISESFIKSCMAQGSSKGYCSCALDKFQEAFSQEEYISRETEAIMTGKFPEPFVKTMIVARTQCQQ